MIEPIVNDTFQLQKYPGKGGWTYAYLPMVPPNKNAPFGWVKVKGTIDGYDIKKYNLMPAGDGKLFLPVKAEIRKTIKKKEGDFVNIVLYLDDEPIEIPEEMLFCLQCEPEAYSFYNSLSENEQINYIKWIYSAKTEETKVERLSKTVGRLQQRLKFYDN